MIKHYSKMNEGVCSRSTEFTVEDGVIKSIVVVGGCMGNLQGIMKLLVGMKVTDAIEKLEGIRCRGSRTGMSSCPDQIAQALKLAL